MKLLEARPNEPALADIFYKDDEIDHFGLVPADTKFYTLRIPMAKHHVISWKILRNAWNKADPLVDQQFICSAIYRVMAGTAVIPNDEAVVRQNVCWSNGNLIIGPEGNIRLFDPGEDIDFEYPAGMAPDKRQRVLDLVKFGSLLKEYQKLPKKNINEAWQLQLENIVKSLEANKINICVFERNTWKMFSRPRVQWKASPVPDGKPEASLISQGYWYQSSVSGECVNRLFPTGATSTTIGLGKIKGERLTDLNNDRQKNLADELAEQLRLSQAQQVLVNNLAKSVAADTDVKYVTAQSLTNSQ